MKMPVARPGAKVMNTQGGGERDRITPSASVAVNDSLLSSIVPINGGGVVNNGPKLESVSACLAMCKDDLIATKTLIQALSSVDHIMAKQIISDASRSSSGSSRRPKKETKERGVPEMMRTPSSLEMEAVLNDRVISAAAISAVTPIGMVMTTMMKKMDDDKGEEDIDKKSNNKNSGEDNDDYNTANVRSSGGGSSLSRHLQSILQRLLSKDDTYMHRPEQHKLGGGGGGGRSGEPPFALVEITYGNSAESIAHRFGRSTSSQRYRVRLFVKARVIATNLKEVKDDKLRPEPLISSIVESVSFTKHDSFLGASMWGDKKLDRNGSIEVGYTGWGGFLTEITIRFALYNKNSNTVVVVGRRGKKPESSPVRTLILPHYITLHENGETSENTVTTLVRCIPAAASAGERDSLVALMEDHKKLEVTRRRSKKTKKCKSRKSMR
eukprot:CAMPEP_0185267156 /NCGR_PEP_ID=MMETSP1359-20130426/33545_1 /TAXON_ID=552665 /ORGANISM="Bigelowiella longifila, Strain CCMP242" /LENGTH=439 /DNA_ID=CAMNT_0027857383 /DNA_START=39 /DNA_END=1358 /DNA_ORIENTATION=-